MLRHAFLAFAGFATLGTAHAQDDWQRVTTRSLQDGAVTEVIVQTNRPPLRPIDRIRLHRYRGRDFDRVPLLYLPGTNMNGSPMATEARHDLFQTLALAGVPVYALDYRTNTLPPENLDEPERLSSWSSEAFVADAAEALRWVLEDSGQERAFVAGFSRGVSLAYALASQAGAPKESIAGLILLDGSFKSAPEHTPDPSADVATRLERLEASGTWASDVATGIGWELRDRLMKAAITDPQGSTLQAPFSDRANVGEQLGRLLYTAWRPGGLANPIEGGRDGVSRIEVLAQLLAGYDRYYPTVQDVDLLEVRRVADAPSPLDDGWGELELPILNFVSSEMGSEWILASLHSAARSGSSDVTPVLLENWGHLDVLVSERSETQVFQRMLRWMSER
ncbi:MAG: hypothetical protein AAGK22_25425 [Acidobacteriota bacterium]